MKKLLMLSAALIVGVAIMAARFVPDQSFTVDNQTGWTIGNITINLDPSGTQPLFVGNTEYWSTPINSGVLSFTMNGTTVANGVATDISVPAGNVHVTWTGPSAITLQIAAGGSLNR